MSLFTKNTDAYPAFYEQYLTSMAQGPDKKTAVDDLTFVVVDTETTGMHLRKDHILSVGYVTVRAGRIPLEEATEMLLELPEQIVDPETIAIHGILPKADKRAITSVAMLEQLLDRLSGAVLVGHHVHFDISMLNRALARCGAGKLKNHIIDTHRLAQRVQPPGYWTQPVDYSLDALGRQYKIPLSDRHTALGDAYITGQLLLKLMFRLKRRERLILNDLLR